MNAHRRYALENISDNPAFIGQDRAYGNCNLLICGAPGEIRTPDRLVRSQQLVSFVVRPIPTTTDCFVFNQLAQ